MFFHILLKSILKSKTALVSVCFLAFVALSLPVSAANQKILVFGDSLSAAYGIPQNQGWVALLQNKLREEKLPYDVINASISGETTSGGLTRIDAALKQIQPQIVILELGANDGLRGLPIKTTRDNLARMVQKIQKNGARVLLVGMKMPPNYGAKYIAEFSATYPQLAKTHQAGLVPFMLEHVAAKPDLIQLDGLHPNALGQPIILNNIWPALKPLLKK
jgi:acyl-CoA thioesterase-1